MGPEELALHQHAAVTEELLLPLLVELLQQAALVGHRDVGGVEPPLRLSGGEDMIKTHAGCVNARGKRVCAALEAHLSWGIYTEMVVVGLVVMPKVTENFKIKSLKLKKKKRYIKCIHTKCKRSCGLNVERPDNYTLILKLSIISQSLSVESARPQPTSSCALIG